ncbi:MAG: DNA translocase FtsK 4TM domain-containing protein [Proteobacteria bacterium]|nr:DNA translocase FtsK 4TM domain-containing protein [Pseudomonadota bacterium]
MMTGALLLGPSLASVQFGRGRLMGPLGQLVGMALNNALGLTAYLLVLWLLAEALQVFAGALPSAASAASREARRRGWRRPTGQLTVLLFAAMLLHLVLHPRRLAHASGGGALGEYTAELLSALLSRPGTWILVLSGLALSLVLSTNLSWVRSTLRLVALLQRVGAATQAALARVPPRLAALRAWLAAQLAYARLPPQLAVDGAGGATLPRVLRLNLEPEGDETLDDGLAPFESGGAAVGGGGLLARLRAHLRGRGTSGPERGWVASPDLGALPDPVEAESAALVHAVAPPGALFGAGPTVQPLVRRLQRSRPARVDDAAGAEPAAKSATSAPEVELTKATVPAAPPREAGAPAALTIVKSPFVPPTPAAVGPADARASVGTEPQTLDPDGTGFVLNGTSYQLPPLSLLTEHGEGRIAIDEDAIQRQAARLTKTLGDYKIFGQVTEVHPGPVVTMYEFVPAPGTRISKVAGLSNDLAMSLHAQRVRIVAPIPGKGAIGIEVPNERRETVSFRDIVGDETFRGKASAPRGSSARAPLKLALGKNIAGLPVVMDLAKAPHLLVAGATGAGKSVSINAMICSLLLRCTPDEVRLILIDPKFLELSGYNGIPHLLLPVVTDPKQAAVALRWAVAEMERRYQLLAAMHVRDIVGFNRKVDRLREGHEGEDGHPTRTAEAGAEARAGAADAAGAPPQRLPYLVVVIDEFADLMMCSAKDVETCVARLAQKARACGIHLIVATQRPSVDVITGLIKANFPSRVAFQVAANHDSKTILGTYGAENLLGAGDMLVIDRGVEMKRVHGAYISDDEIRAIIDWLRQQGRPIYDMDILKDDEEGEEGAAQPDEPRDELYDQALALVAESRQASISMVQRRLRIGYNRAARLVERMEREGVVGPADGVRGREVLIQHHEP